jgi:hypothetical protein
LEISTSSIFPSSFGNVSKYVVLETFHALKMLLGQCSRFGFRKASARMWSNIIDKNKNYHRFDQHEGKENSIDEGKGNIW